jgi:hypothetical protein
MPLPVNPTPITGASHSLSGPAQYPTSGTVVSGVSAFAGPWMIETQTMNIEYVRVPKSLVFQGDDVTLDRAEVTMSMGGTELLARVTAEYKVEKTYSTYSTSGYQQPQRFEITALSGDASGNTYGALNGSSLGPQGSINTIQPYVRRRAWIDGQDVVVQKSCDGADFTARQNIPGNYGTGNDIVRHNIDQSVHVNDFASWARGSSLAHTFLSVFDTEKGFTVGNTYQLGGPYTTSQETQFKLLQYLDAMGDKVTGVSLYSVPTNQTSASPIPQPIKDQGFGEYSISRHSYDNL